MFIVAYFDQRLGVRTPNAGRNSHFQRLLCKKAKKKQEICCKFLPKTRFFKFAPKRWLTVKNAENDCIEIYISS